MSTQAKISAHVANHTPSFEASPSGRRTPRWAPGPCCRCTVRVSLYEALLALCDDPDAAFPELFLFGAACLRAGPPYARPEPPEIVRALARAKDRRAAFESLAPAPFWPYEYEPFVERGELVHRSMVAGRDVYGEPLDLSD